MIIWNWLIANAFKYYENNDNVLIFASWVSNSQNKDLLLFKKEIDLLEKTLKENPNKLFVYISSCSIDDETMKNSLYVKHKINAENTIKYLSKNYLIIRTSNPVWKTKNPNTLLNFLYEKIVSWENFNIWINARRNLIDVKDLFKISKEIIDNNLFNNSTINIANKLYFDILEIVNIFENITKYKANYTIEELWWTPNINIENIENIIEKLNINFDKSYLEKLIKKYYN